MTSNNRNLIKRFKVSFRLNNIVLSDDERSLILNSILLIMMEEISLSFMISIRMGLTD